MVVVFSDLAGWVSQVVAFAPLCCCSSSQACPVEVARCVWADEASCILYERTQGSEEDPQEWFMEDQGEWGGEQMTM